MRAPSAHFLQDRASLSHLAAGQDDAGGYVRAHAAAYATGVRCGVQIASSEDPRRTMYAQRLGSEAMFDVYFDVDPALGTDDRIELTSGRYSGRAFLALAPSEPPGTPARYWRVAAADIR